MAQLDEFRATLTTGDAVAGLRAGLIGDDVVIDGPFGPVPMIYADYVASGRALRQVEEFVLTRVLPYYANTHTQASFVGAYCSGLREAARACVAGMVGGGPGYSPICPRWRRCWRIRRGPICWWAAFRRLRT